MSNYIHRCICLTSGIVAGLFCLFHAWAGPLEPREADGDSTEIPTPRHSHKIPEITPEMFFQPLLYRADVVLDAGDLGRYRFLEDTDTHRVPETVTIRRRLVKLLNELQIEFEHPIQLIAGYRSEQHQIYLWAKWLEENPSKRKVLNNRDYDSWARWVAQSQRMEGWHPLASKHQTGDAVRFYWRGLAFDKKKGERLTERIRELGGSRRYTARERKKFNISTGDNALFKVTAYPEGTDVSLENPLGRACFHIEYQPSLAPEIPAPSRIGRRIDSSPAHRHIYQKGDIVFIEVEDHHYLGEVMEDVHETDTRLEAWLFVDTIRKALGTEISVKRVSHKRQKPKKGWGKEKVALEYLHGDTWEFSWDVERFADHYRLQLDSRERRLEFDEVRYTIPQHRHSKPR